MCEPPASSAQKGRKERQAPARRRKLWELEDRFHCPVIGTCLTLEDLEKVVRRSGVALRTRRPTDFDLHVGLVQLASTRCRASRNLQKLLERRFARHVRRAAAVNDEADLVQLWQEAKANGDLAGTFWAVVTHPALGDALAHRLYGEIHMLSHISGRSHREELARIPALEQQTAELETALDRAGARNRDALAQRDRRIEDLERQLARTRGELRQLESAPPPEPGDAVSLGQERRRADRLEARLAEREHRLDERAMEIQALKELLSETREDLARSDDLLRRRLELSTPVSDGTPRPDLAGRHIVYVGGRPSMAQHLRAVVEQYQGHFSHHDGGKEDNRADIESALGSADLVFCPVDCVSHDACRRVKQYCKRREARFVPLRAASLSSFVHELRRVAAELPPAGGEGIRRLG